MNVTRKNRKRSDEVMTKGVVATSMILSVCLLAEVFFATWCGVQCRRAGYDIVQVQNQQDKLLELQKKLQIERVRLQSPQILGRYARENLDLTVPTPEQIIVVP